MAYEVNFDGLIGPTHNYAGLSHGNLASEHNKGNLSNPKEAALQGLEKMYTLHKLGFKQAVLPPHERPYLPALLQIGFKGTDQEIFCNAFKQAPEILASLCSAASMWTANAATITPSVDSEDHKFHITPANLATKFHRAIEADFNYNLFQTIFYNDDLFCVHPPLMQGSFFSDEGAANHTRLCEEYGKKGVHLFVYGRYGFKANVIAPIRFPGRQTFEAFQAIARIHNIPENLVVYAQQSPQAIDSGVFHNDVIGVGNCNVYFCHELAYLEQEAVLADLAHKYEKITSKPLHIIEVKEEEVPLKEAVAAYLFNSQLLNTDDGMLLLAPAECQESSIVSRYLELLLAKPNSPIKRVLFTNLRQSMCNGGGPACLRLRVVLTPAELQQIPPSLMLTDGLYIELKNWITNHYREQFSIVDLQDPDLLDEVYRTLDKLTQILDLGPIYSFQKDE